MPEAIITIPSQAANGLKLTSASACHPCEVLTSETQSTLGHFAHVLLTSLPGLNNPNECLPPSDRLVEIINAAEMLATHIRFVLNWEARTQCSVVRVFSRPWPFETQLVKCYVIFMKI